jgi:uncharacterized protein DUF6916
MPDLLGVKDFVPHKNTIFRIEDPGIIELELAEVNDRSNAQLEQFSLIFKGPLTPWLLQSTYLLLHPQLGEQAIFIVPLGPRDGRMIYEAIFGRFISDNTKPATTSTSD